MRVLSIACAVFALQIAALTPALGQEAPSVASLEQVARFETLIDTDPKAALDLAETILATQDDDNLRLIFARAALAAGEPARALTFLAPLASRLAAIDPRRTESFDLTAAAQDKLGDPRAALRARLAAYDTLEKRLGPENPALLMRLEALRPQVEALMPQILPQLEAMRAVLLESARPAAKSLRAEGKPDAVTVWYGTNRAATGNPDPAQAYGSERGDLSVGKLVVTIPPNHLAGMIERPGGWVFTDHLDPNEHVVLAEIAQMGREAFAAGCCGSEDRLLFVHGYNVSFHDGALRAAQLSYDLEFPGQTMYYSWPSKGSLYGYLSDANGVVSTRPAMEEFFEIATRGSGKLHVIAHSMGNRYTLEALETFLLRHPDRHLGQLVLAAPDVDRAEFLARFPVLRNHVDGVTLYASKHDLALKVSRQVNGGARLGDANDQVVTIDGLDTVDASRIEADSLGHSYFGDAPQILGDILGLVRLGWSAEERCSVAPRAATQGRLWEVEPDGCRVEAVRAAGDLLRIYGVQALAEAQRRLDVAPGDQVEFWQGVMAVVQTSLPQ
ncbi:esterase/lipase superfamily enzyme [Rhodobacter sp. JA431]|uniref:alpha/beta hydrolase n=1 Tax=Rhodobacter sp. JA431 TaxID=570013 RepID=UPI000BCA238E|nr:alpha/beta hydrolase [Rhodobacter sp. JA431]SOC21001.1 esterase/lipase superfamily enzyme [Rhodobacter sp. JA431]